jgi:exportin-2 (importin alpha re-exporter)
LALLSLCGQGDSQQSAALYFKNTIKRYWTFEEAAIPESDRVEIKRTIVDISLATPVNIQVQLCEAISFIADSDFPDKWDSLISTLSSKLSPSDWGVNNGVLLICHSIFKRWRGRFRTDALFKEIKLVLAQVCLSITPSFAQRILHCSRLPMRTSRQIFQTRKC